MRKMKIEVKVIDDTISNCVHEETHTLMIIRMLKFATTVVLGEHLSVAN